MLDLSCFLAGLINFFVPLFLLLFFKKKFDSGVFPALAAFIACFPAFITGALIRSLFMTDDLLTFYIMQGILFGILEEGTKYLMLRFFLTSYDRKENTLSYGIGHSAYEGFGSAISCLGLIGSGKAASDILSFQIMTVIDRTVFTISLTVLIFYGIKKGKSKVMLPAAMLLHALSSAFTGTFSFSDTITIIGNTILTGGICFAAFHCWQMMRCQDDD